jgi:signal transduction histidine kinase/CheY-like chemotaxis protein
MDSEPHATMDRQYRLRLGHAGVDTASRFSRTVSLLARADSLSALWGELLGAALGLLEHECGHIQVWDEEAATLQLAAQRGFENKPASALAVLCSAAFNSLSVRQGRVLIQDARKAGCSAGVCEALRACGCVGVHVMPLVNPEGRLFGVLTTYDGSECTQVRPHLGRLDELALQAVCFAEHLQERATLTAAARRKDDFLATLAHELRNSLAPLRSSLEILKLHETADPLQSRARAILDRRLKTITRLVEDLMNASRIACGKLDLCREPVALANVLEMAVETATPRLQERRHEFTLQLHDRFVELDGDPVRLVQVFVNLLDNAIKYTPAGGRIGVSTRAARAGVCVEVRDSGIGLTPDSIPQVFDLFSQASLGRAHREGGLGIGLALAKKIVELHAGSIEASSEGAGRGSVFRVWLPVASSQAERRELEQFSPPALTLDLFSLRVLVVDDNADAADSLSALLRAHGHQTRSAHDGIEAVEVTQEFHPDLILMDLAMPGLDGAQAARRRIRELPLPQQPEIIELTGATEGGRPASEGMRGLLVKPVSYTALQQIVSRTAEKVNASGGVSAQFVVASLKLALTAIESAELVGDIARREHLLQVARSSHERAMLLGARLAAEDPQRAQVEELLRSLEVKLASCERSWP